LAIGQFVTIFVGSLALGVAIALLAAVVFKYTSMQAYPYLETALIALFAYSSYLVAEGLHLSGIVAILFCGIAMAQYAYRNLSEASQKLSLHFFSILALMTETLVFGYLGLALFAFADQFDPVFIIGGIVIILAARALNIYPLTYLVNQSRPKDRRITQKYQFFMWFAGLRGAIAFVLSLDVPTPHKVVMKTTTIVIIFFTILVMGGITIPLLSKLGIPTGIEKAPVVAEDTYGKLNVRIQNKFQALDKKLFKPIFVKDRPEDYDNIGMEATHHGHADSVDSIEDGVAEDANFKPVQLEE